MGGRLYVALWRGADHAACRQTMRGLRIDGIPQRRLDIGAGLRRNDGEEAALASAAQE